MPCNDVPITLEEMRQLDQHNRRQTGRSLIDTLNEEIKETLAENDCLSPLLKNIDPGQRMDLERERPLAYMTPTPYGQILAMYDLVGLSDRRFWELFCERNQYPLGYLAGIRAMGMVQEIENLRKEICLMRETIEKRGSL